MSSGHTTTTAYFVIAGAIILAGLVLFAPWQVWGLVVIAVATGTLVALLRRTIGRRSWSTPPPEPTPVYEPPPAPRREKRLTHVRLPSSREDYCFLFSATVLWTPLQPVMDESSVNTAALAVNSIVARAYEITSRRSPDHASLVQLELGHALATPQPDANGYLHATAESVELVLPDADQERLDKLAAVRKSQDLWEHERRYEQSRRQYLSQDVLKDAGSAVVWWLARNDDQVEKTVHDIGLLTRLSSAANNADPTDNYQLGLPGLNDIPTPRTYDSDFDGDSPPAGESLSAIDRLDAFLRAADFIKNDDERILFARRVADAAARHGGQGWADEVRHRYIPHESNPDEPNDPQDATPAF